MLFTSRAGEKLPLAPLSPTMWLLVFYSVHRVHSGYVPCVVYNTTSYWKNVKEVTGRPWSFILVVGLLYYEIKYFFLKDFIWNGLVYHFRL